MKFRYPLHSWHNSGYSSCNETVLQLKPFQHWTIQHCVKGIPVTLILEASYSQRTGCEVFHICTTFFGKFEMRTRYTCTTCLRHVCPYSIRDTSLSRCLVIYSQPATKNKENLLIISWIMEKVTSHCFMCSSVFCFLRIVRSCRTMRVTCCYFDKLGHLVSGRDTGQDDQFRSFRNDVCP